MATLSIVVARSESRRSRKERTKTEDEGDDDENCAIGEWRPAPMEERAILCDTCEKSSLCRTLVRVDKSSAGLAIVDLCYSAAAYDCAQATTVHSTAVVR